MPKVRIESLGKEIELKFSKYEVVDISRCAYTFGGEEIKLGVIVRAVHYHNLLNPSYYVLPLAQLYIKPLMEESRNINDSTLFCNEEELRKLPEELQSAVDVYEMYAWTENDIEIL